MRGCQPLSMSVTTIIYSVLILTTFTTKTTMSCSCSQWPTLDTMLQDENAYIFRGIVIPQFLSLFSSLANDSYTGPSNKYTVRIQKVYKNGCATGSSDVSRTNLSSFLLPDRQTITLISPKNSCGISSLPIFRTFLFTGVFTISDSSNNDRSRTLQHGQEKSSMYNKPSIIPDASSDKTRRNTLRRIESTSFPATMDVNLCGNFIHLWRTVTPAEKDAISNLPSSAANATTFECSGDNRQYL